MRTTLKRFFSWIRRIAVIGIATLVVLTLAAAVWQSAATRRIERQHPQPGQLVDVGGHRLHLHIRGGGTPTVVIDAGLSGASYDWQDVASGIAGFATVVAYDRAGYGWSDQGPLPRTSQRVVAELRTALANAGLHPPFVLLGHSWGGLNMRLYASLHSEEVAGLMLVDAVNTDLYPESAQPGAVPALYTLLNHTAFLGPQRWVTPGIIREPMKDLPAREFRLAMLNRTKSTRAIYDELTGQANWLQVRAAMRHLDNLPVMVITTQLDPVRATNGTWVGGPDWLKTQHALTNISHQSRFIVADTTEHDIQFHRPEQIVGAVREMVEKLRLPDSASLQSRKPMASER